MTRLVLLVPAVSAFAALLWTGLSGLPDPGVLQTPYAVIANRLLVEEEHLANAVSGVILDLRPLDTLIEELVVFASVIGLSIIVREEKEGVYHAKDEPTPLGMQVSLTAMVPAIVVLGAYVTGWGHLSPGGGFQGGVILGSAFLCPYLAGRMRAFHASTRETPLDEAESIGVVALAALGAVGLAFGGLYVSFLPRGELHSLLSGGIVPIGNLVIACAVTVGIGLVVSDFVEQLRIGGDRS